MPRLILLSDTHGQHQVVGSDLFPLPEGDIIIHAGDISGRGSIFRQWEIEEFLNWFSSLTQYKHKLFIAGNHDLLFETHPEVAKRLIPDNVTYLEDSGIEIEGLKFWGSPYTPTFFRWAFMKDRGEPIKKHWDLIPDDTEVLITHGPPKNILDWVPGDKHVGCEELLKRVKELKNLKLSIHGHLHSNYNKGKTIDGVKFVGASLLDEQYQLVRKPIVIDL